MLFPDVPRVGYRFGLLFLALLVGGIAHAAEIVDAPLIDLKKLDPSIVVDLRYATANNVTHHPLYAPHMPALVRATVAERLVAAQTYLRAHGFGLKIWDAYRPLSAHRKLWESTKATTYVADPNDSIGSLHTRGVAVDATLVDNWGRPVEMPTDFDNFTPAAMLNYSGTNAKIRFHLQMLQSAMGRVGFYGLRTEWWHFCAEDWAKFRPVAESVALPEKARD